MLKDSEREFQNIFDNAHDAIIIFDPNGEIVLDVNQQACRMYGYDRNEFIGMSLESISPDVPKGKTRIKETLEHGSYFNFETIQFRKDGSKMYLEINASVITYRGKNVIISINRDISRRKTAEQQIKKSLAEKETLLKEIHHRVKNNMQVVASLLDLQSQNINDPKVISILKKSKDRIHSMAMIHECLYRSENLSSIDMPQYLEEIVASLVAGHNRFRETITLNTSFQNLQIDTEKAIPVGLILTELFSNSLKHAFPSRTGTIDIQFYSSPNRQITLKVADNGIGFPTTFNIHESTSLGLQLVDILTRQLGGRLIIENNSGTNISITFPLPSEVNISHGEIKESTPHHILTLTTQ